jgi:hypothetical protein
MKSDEVLLSYIKPSVNPLQCVGGTEAESLISKLVNNLVEATAQNPQNAPPADSTGKEIAIINCATKGFISIQNFDPGQSSAFLRLFDFSGKLCQETKLDLTTLAKDIPLSLAPGYYKAQIVEGIEVVHNQKMIVLK